MFRFLVEYLFEKAVFRLHLYLYLILEDLADRYCPPLAASAKNFFRELRNLPVSLEQLYNNLYTFGEVFFL